MMREDDKLIADLDATIAGLENNPETRELFTDIRAVYLGLMETEKRVAQLLEALQCDERETQ